MDGVQNPSFCDSLQSAKLGVVVKLHFIIDIYDLNSFKF